MKDKKEILIIGSGISGLTCAIESAARGIHVTLVSPYPSERAQSVLAAGGINAVLHKEASEDSTDCHISDTLKGGLNIAGKEAVRGLCEDAPQIIKWLEKIGTVFTQEDGNVAQRAFGGQTYNRTCYCGASTGKQIVTALIMEARRYECMGLITRRNRTQFMSALIKDGRCYGAVVFDEASGNAEIIRADAVVMATGGQNCLFGKTTGSKLNDGYAAGRLFMQGVDLKNLEFIQYHPTTIRTAQKKMLVSEAARGEGGRLYYMDGDSRVYFMEDKFGPKGNLMPRDVVSRCIYETGKQVYLDVSFLGREKIMKRIPEVYDLCMKYIGIDISRESIPIEPSVHFFMGGIAVNLKHQTNIEDLYAVGECASIYHGANRLGGNSLLAAVHSGKVAAAAIDDKAERREDVLFDEELNAAKKALQEEAGGTLTAEDVRVKRASVMNTNLGIVREDSELLKGIEDIDSLISECESGLRGSSYERYTMISVLTLARAVLVCARERKESRGSQLRRDYPDTSEDYGCATIISYDGGDFSVTYDREGRYES